MKHFFWNTLFTIFPKRQTKLKTRKNRKVGPAAQIIEVQQQATKDDSGQCRGGEATEEIIEVHQKADNKCKPTITVEGHQMNEIICSVENLKPKVNEISAIEI